MGWLKIEKLEYLENGTWLFYEIKNFLICASDDTFWEVIVFVTEVTFKDENFNILCAHWKIWHLRGWCFWGDGGKGEGGVDTPINNMKLPNVHIQTFQKCWSFIWSAFSLWVSLISCFQDQRTFFHSITSLSLISHKTDMRKMW